MSEKEGGRTASCIVRHLSKEAKRKTSQRQKTANRSKLLLFTDERKKERLHRENPGLFSYLAAGLNKVDTYSTCFQNALYFGCCDFSELSYFS